MREVSQRNFGLLIAYIVPGFVALWGVSFLLPEVRMWLTGWDAEGPTVGGFLYVTIASIAGGMVANAVRWAIVDTAHHATGLTRPPWSDAFLHEKVAAYEWLIENHYRHYQFYGNTLFSVLFTYACWRVSLAGSGSGVGWLDGAIGALSIVLAAGSRTTLARYYRRAESLLGATPPTPPMPQGEHAMANGGHPKPASGPAPKTDPKKPDVKNPKSQDR